MTSAIRLMETQQGRVDQHADYYRCTTMKYLAALLVIVTFCGCGGGDVPKPDVAKPSGKELQTLTGHADYVSGVSFSPNGQRIVSGSGDKTVKIWDASE